MLAVTFFFKFNFR